MLVWQSYIAKRGTLHTGRRIEAAAALIATTINRAHGGKARMEDYMPHESLDKNIDGAKDDDVIKFFEGLANGK